MRTVWKYILPVTDRPRIIMKKGAEILHVDATGDFDKIALWALVEDSEKNIERFFRIYGTGHNMEEFRYDQKFLGTVVDKENEFVWHVWTD